MSRRSFHAVADFADEDKSRGRGNTSSDDGLEISKLGINKQIVSALAEKGITKLFPIQVLSFNFLVGCIIC